MPSGCITTATSIAPVTKSWGCRTVAFGDLYSRLRRHFHVRDARVSSYLLDTWRVSKRLQFDAGIRAGLGSARFETSPGLRALAFSWSPFASGRTRISGGYSITHDASTWRCWGGRSIRPRLPRNTTQGMPAVASRADDQFSHRECPSRTAARHQLELNVDHNLAARFFDGEVSAAARNGRFRVRQLAGAGCAAVAVALAGTPRHPASTSSPTSPRRLRFGADFRAAKILGPVRMDGVLHAFARALQRGARSQHGHSPASLA